MNDYFPLQSKVVSVRGMAPPKDAETRKGKKVWLDEQIFSLRNMAAVRSNSNAENVFDQGFPNCIREIVTPSGNWLLWNTDEVERGWKNWVGGYENNEAQKIDDLQSTDELKNLIEYAAKNDKKVRAVGSGHSHSEAAKPDKTFTNIKSFSGKLDQKWIRKSSDSFWSKSGINRSHLVRLGAGTILRDLNRNILTEKGLGLPNMGAWDGQTLAGAINTSTHGTGLNLGTLADLVQSVEIATVVESEHEKGIPYVRLLRVEPSEGITDPTKFAKDTSKHSMGLIQNDELFRSIVVGYGCMGIVYAYTLEVRESYWLEEESELMDWNTLKSKLSPSASENKAEAVENFITKDHTRHFHFLLNVAADQVPDNRIKNDEHEGPNNPACLVYRHKITQPKDEPSNWGKEPFQRYDSRWPPERRKTSTRDFLKVIGNKPHPLKPNKGKAKQLHNNFFSIEADKAPFVKKRTKTAWYIALRRLRDRDKPNPRPPSIPATTTEVAIPLDQLVDAIDAVRDKIADIKQENPIPNKSADGQGRKVFFMVPMGVRFTDSSDQFFSPEFGRKTAMIEIPIPVSEGKTKANLRTNVPTLTQDELREHVAEPALEKIEDVLVKEFNGRPHMGKHNSINANSSRRYMRPQHIYPKYDEWKTAFNYFNKFGTFESEFSNNKVKMGG